MSLHVCTGAMMMCTMGAAPATFTATPKMVKTGNMDAGNIMDFVPMVNIPTFGVCKSPANPMVAAATTAALGVLTPMPCIPVVVAPWTPGSATVLVSMMPALDQMSKAMCTWAGSISIVNAGQFTEMIP